MAEEGGGGNLPMNDEKVVQVHFRQEREIGRMHFDAIGSWENYTIGVSID